MPANQMQSAFISAVRQSDSIANGLKNQRCWLDVELNGVKFHLRIKNDKVEKVTPHGHRGSWFQRLTGQAVEQRLLKAVKDFHVSAITSTAFAAQAKECLVREYCVDNLRDIQSQKYCVDKLNGVVCPSGRNRGLSFPEAAPKSMTLDYDVELHSTPAGLASSKITVYDDESHPSTETRSNSITTKCHADDEFDSFHKRSSKSMRSKYETESNFSTETVPYSKILAHYAKLNSCPLSPTNSMSSAYHNELEWELSSSVSQDRYGTVPK